MAKTTRSKPAVVDQRPQTAGYKPIPQSWFQQPRDLPSFSFATIRAMLMDPEVRLNLLTRAAPLHGVQFGFKQGGQWTEGVQARRPEVGAFIYRQLTRIWSSHLSALLRSQVWGWSGGEVTLTLTSQNLIEIDELLPRHASDIRLLKVNGDKVGIRVSRVEGKPPVDLMYPYCFFHCYGVEDGADYGTSCMLSAYSPWADKWFNGGALDVRRLFMHKDAYGGVDLGYPNGDTQIVGHDDPVPNSDIARQIVEQIQAGGVTTRPSERDENGNEKWPLERATVPNNPQHILQYPKDLDDEIRHGMGIADDVITSDGGGGWAGKRIPLAAFYASLDVWVVDMIRDLKPTLDALILLNWGCHQEYEITHKPLAEQAMEQQSNAGPGQPGQPGNGMVDGENPYRMSLNPVDAVGQGVMSAAELVAAARGIMLQREMTQHA